MAAIRFVFLCQAVDLNHPTQAAAVKWIESFAKHPQVEDVIVISLRAGEYVLPDNVKVFAVQKKNRLITIFHFYSMLFRILFDGKIDFFWINQGGPYPLMLLPFKIFLKKPIYQWKAHPYISMPMKFYARYCDTKIFTCTAKSFPMIVPKVKIVGHGIDVNIFRIETVEKTGDLVTAGRITPSKHIELMLRVLDMCRHQYGKAYRLDIYGSEDTKNLGYKEHLETLIQERHLSEYVLFKGQVKQTELPAILNRYRVFLNFSETALDKAVVEAMACGVSVLSTNPCVSEILPQDLNPLLFAPEDNVERLAKLLHDLLSQPEAHLAKMGKTLREVAVQHHSVESLIQKILAEIGKSEQ